MNSKNILHGNSARIDGRKNIIPRFTNYVGNEGLADFESGAGAPYYKPYYNPSVNRLEDGAEFLRKEAEANKL